MTTYESLKLPQRIKNRMLERRNAEIARILTEKDPAAAFRSSVPAGNRLSANVEAIARRAPAAAQGNAQQPRRTRIRTERR